MNMRRTFGTSTSFLRRFLLQRSESASNSTTLDAEEGDEEQLSIVECFLCRGKFVSERALEQHSAAKHALAPSSSPSAASLSLDKEAAVGDEDKREWGGRERSRADSFPTYLSLDNVLFEQDDAAKVPSCDECFLQILSGDANFLSHSTLRSSMETTRVSATHTPRCTAPTRR